jgi:hypothetical protein
MAYVYPVSFSCSLGDWASQKLVSMKLLPDFNNCYLYTKIMKSIQITGYGGNDVVEVKKTASVPNISIKL